jgi:hypothetical protein
MLVFTLEYRKAVDMMTGAKKNNLQRFEMGEDEWKVAGELCRVLKVSTVATQPVRQLIVPAFQPVPIQVFKDATLFFSCSTPNLAMVIPAMDHINECLTNDSLNHNYQPCIWVALNLAKKNTKSILLENRPVRPLQNHYGYAVLLVR